MPASWAGEELVVTRPWKSACGDSKDNDGGRALHSSSPAYPRAVGDESEGGHY